MTLIVAVKSKNAVIIAADSQISYGHSSLRTDTSKIEQVEFSKFRAIVALAEDVDNARRYIDILRGMAKGSEPKTADEVGVVIQSAMRALRNEVAANLGTTTATELDKMINEQALNCSMTVAFCINREPHIVQTSLLKVVYHRSRANYETDGCGASLADFILKEYFVPDSDFEKTALMAIYAAWTATKHDRYCRGPIVVAAACPYAGFGKGPLPESRVIEFSRERIEGLITLIQQADAATKQARHTVINDAFAAREAAFHCLLEMEIANLPEPTEAQFREMAEELAVDEEPTDLSEGDGLDR